VFNPYGDVLLAYEMNGEDIPLDHGYPVRAVVPGHVGVRSVKWVTAVIASAEEAKGPWQSGMAYKMLPSTMKDLTGVDIESKVRARPCANWPTRCCPKYHEGLTALRFNCVLYIYEPGPHVYVAAHCTSCELL
jgi:hypothetical protein